MSDDGTPQQRALPLDLCSQSPSPKETKGMAKARAVAEAKFARKAKQRLKDPKEPVYRETKGMAKAKAVAEAKFARRAHAEEKARAIAEAKLARIARAEAYFYAQREYLSDGATKKCRRCREIRTIDLFPPNGRQKDGLNMQCVVCIRTMILERNLKTQIYYGTNIEAIRARTQIYRRENPEVGLAASHRHRTRVKGNGGSFSVLDIRSMREAQNHQCAYCQRAIKLTIDHIHPVSKGGSSDISNICLACRKCNSSKGAKLLEEWVNRWYERDR